MIRAITEIPANTPRPMGRTDRCFPGTLKEESEDAVASAAADAGVAAALEPPPEIAPPALAEDAAGGVEEGGAGEDVVVDDGVPEAGMPRVVTGVAKTGGVLGGTLALLLLLLSDEEVAAVVREGATLGVEDVPVDDDDVAEDVDELVDEDEGEIVVVDVPAELGDSDGGWLFPREPESASVVTVHDFTSWTTELPLESVTGVRVMVHVSVIGPIIVWLVWVVTRVVGELKPPAWRGVNRSKLAGIALTRPRGQNAKIRQSNRKRVEQDIEEYRESLKASIRGGTVPAVP